MDCPVSRLPYGCPKLDFIDDKYYKTEKTPVLDLDISDIQDITLLSIPQAEKIIKDGHQEDIMKLELDCWWWLRSPGDNQNYAALVLEDGSVYYFGIYVYNVNYCVRPALIISNLKSFNLPIYSI